MKRESCPLAEYCHTQATAFGELSDTLGPLMQTSYDGLQQPGPRIPGAEQMWAASAADASMMDLALPGLVRQLTPPDPCEESCPLVTLANSMAPQEPPTPA